VPTSDSKGQILVITAAALVVLLGIAALVVDLGFGVLLRRQEQNAVDPGAVAAARFIDDLTGAFIDMPMAEAAACHYARQNAFFQSATTDDTLPGGTGCVPANDSHGAVLEVVWPPDARADQFQGASGMVQVVLTRERDTFFGSLLGIGALSVSTDAVAARQRGETNTHSLIALNPTDCATAWLHGNGTIQIYAAPGYTGPGGYVHVKSECDQGAVGDDNCTNQDGALRIDGSTTELIAPKVNVHGSCRSTGDQITGVLDEGASAIDDPLAGLVFPPWDTSVPGATCGTGPGADPLNATGQYSTGCSASGPGRHWVPSDPALCPGLPSGYDCIHLQPGIYYGGWDIGNKLRVVLAPGIYVMAGGGIKIGATGSIDSVQAGGALPAPVMIYNTDNPTANCPSGVATDCQADLDLTAGGKLALAGLLANEACPPVTTDPDPLNPDDDGCPFGGMVIWYDAEGSQGYTGQVDLEGGVELFISGTIYAPTAHVDLHGNVETNCGSSPTQVAAVQIISWTWKIGGTGDLCMPYDPSLLYHLTLQGLVH
jgi:hypothetical protein